MLPLCYGKVSTSLGTVVSTKPFSHGTGTLRCLQKEMATYRHWSVSLWRDPDDVPRCGILSRDKTEWRLISATLCGWRRGFVADQLWVMTRIQEEEEEQTKSGSGVMSCSVDHHVSGCEYFDRCLYVSKINSTATSRSADKTWQVCSW